LKFEKRAQLFIGVRNETLSVAAMCVAMKMVRRLESIAETQPQLQPDALRLSAISSKYFISRRATPLLPEQVD
jgi:hypothetical protein